MLINLRNALMAGKRLPYDAEVEYLESTGTQWIDTGVLANGEFDFDYMFRLNTLSGNTVGMGARSASQFLTALQINGNQRFVFAYLGTVWSQAMWNVTNNKDYRVQLHFHSGSQSAIVDGTVLFTYNSVGTESLNLPIYIFKRSNSETETTYGLSGRFYFCKIWQNNILVRDYIPVRKGTVGYLYDRVSGKLFGNAGAGDFVLGQDVVPVEYIESHGTEWIDTGIVATDAHGVRIDIATAQKSGTVNARIFGTHQGDVRFGFALYGAGQASGYTAFWGWNAATQISEAIPQRFVASLNYQNDRKAIFNGTTYISSLGTLGSITIPFYLLNANYGGAPFSGQYVIGKLYGAEVSVGSSIANRYKPIRVGTGSTWEGAMIDTLTRRIYRNAGTGAFTYGNDLKYPIPAE